MKKETVIISNKIEELPVLAEKVEELVMLWDLPMPLAMNINLVLEEAVSNVIFYAFNDALPHDITIHFSFDQPILTIELVDDGLPFDPTVQKAPDLTLSAEERPIGGLGIFLIKKIMDQVLYQRKENRNSLLMTKKIE